MGWKTIKGSRYYYKSEWVGSQLKTTYFSSENRDALKIEEIGASAEGVDAELVQMQFIELFGV
jgi:hypothetical protein